MPTNLLTPKAILAAKLPAGKTVKHLKDGDGLTLIFTRSTVPGVKTLVCRASYRYLSPTTGKRRELGCGSIDLENLEATLPAARKRAQEAREMVAHGQDPLDAKTVPQAPVAAPQADGRVTLLAFAKQYHGREVAGVLSEKHGKQWLRSIENYVPKALLARPVAAITAAELLDALAPLCRSHGETASRVFQRLRRIFDDAVVREIRPGNPCRVIEAPITDKTKNRAKGHHPSMPWAELPTFFGRLREAGGTGARALEWTILTGCRTGDTLGAAWSEIDIERKTWTIPRARMKVADGNRPDHVVHLSAAALQVLVQVQGLSRTWVFPSPMNRNKTPQPLSTGAMDNVVRDLGLHKIASVHGMRASLRTWCREKGIAADVAEALLDHAPPKLTDAYMRSDLAQERAAALDLWAAHCVSLCPIPQAPATEWTTEAYASQEHAAEVQRQVDAWNAQVAGRLQ